MTKTVEEIRNELINKYGWTKEYAYTIKGKANLIGELNKLQNQEPDEESIEFDNLDVTIVEDEDDLSNKDRDVPRPSMFDLGWTDYVVGMLDKKEMISGNPKTDGLFRIAQKLFGRASIYSNPIHASLGAAVIKVTVVFPDGDTYEDVAEVYTEEQFRNTDDPYSKYPAATAHTRALGRALRRALNIQVTTAEELSSAALAETIVPHDEQRTEGGITDTQIRFIDLLCKPEKLDLNVKNVVNNLFPSTNNINDLSHSSALHINEKLSEWQQNRDNIPQGIGPYNPDWQSSFLESETKDGH